MNQTIHAHQVLHDFACRDDTQERRVQARGVSPTLAGERKGKQGHLVNARWIAIAILVVVPLIMIELVIAAAATDGWVNGVMDQTAQLLALAQPF